MPANAKARWAIAQKYRSFKDEAQKKGTLQSQSPTECTSPSQLQKISWLLPHHPPEAMRMLIESVCNPTELRASKRHLWSRKLTLLSFFSPAFSVFSTLLLQLFFLGKSADSWPATLSHFIAACLHLLFFANCIGSPSFFRIAFSLCFGHLFVNQWCDTTTLRPHAEDKGTLNCWV